MTTKQWAARAVLAATMAAGLSACGGGGDSAMPAAAPAQEVLAPGLTLRESTGAAPADGAYSVKVVVGLVDATDAVFPPDKKTPGFTTFVFINLPKESLGGSITATKDGSITRALLYGKNTSANPVACGIEGLSNPCKGFKVNLITGTFTATSVVLKAVNQAWSGPADTPGQVTISGSVSADAQIFPPPP